MDATPKAAPNAAPAETPTDLTMSAEGRQVVVRAGGLGKALVMTPDETRRVAHALLHLADGIAPPGGWYAELAARVEAGRRRK